MGGIDVEIITAASPTTEIKAKGIMDSTYSDEPTVTLAAFRLRFGILQSTL
jgi:hypothetical protein